MGRLTIDDIGTGGLYLRLKEKGESCRVMPILDPNDEGEGIYIYGQHWPGDDEPKGPPVPCLRPEPCPLCEAGRKADYRMAMTVYDIDTKTKRILDGFPAAWIHDLKKVLKRWDWKKVVLEIERTGEKAQTRRNPIPFPADDGQMTAALMQVPFSIEELMTKTGPTVKSKQSDSSPEYRDDPGPEHDQNDPLKPDDDDLPF